MIHHGRAEAGPYLKNLLCEKGQSGNARYAACGYYVQVYRSSSPGFTIEQQRSSIYDTAALLLCLYDTLTTKSHDISGRINHEAEKTVLHTHVKELHEDTTKKRSAT
jgi:hypothetical protein